MTERVDACDGTDDGGNKMCSECMRMLFPKMWSQAVIRLSVLEFLLGLSHLVQASGLANYCSSVQATAKGAGRRPKETGVFGSREDIVWYVEAFFACQEKRRLSAVE